MPKSHKKLRNMSEEELQLHFLMQYLEHNDHRALSLLKRAWPEIPWEDAVAELCTHHMLRLDQQSFPA